MLVRSWPILALAALGCPSIAQSPEPTRLPPTGNAPVAPVASVRLLVTFRGNGVDYSELSRANRGNATAAEIDGIVKKLERAAATAQAAFAARVAALGGTIAHHYWLVNSCAITVPPGAVAAISADPLVLRTDPDEPNAPAILPIRTSTDAQHHGTDAVQTAGALGEGVTVAILDGGFDTGANPQGRPHLEYYPNGSTSVPTTWGVSGSRIAATYTMGSQLLTAADDHGTAVSGVSAGAKWSNALECDNGHAPRASLALWAMADFANGNTLPSTQIAAWQNVVAQRAQKRIVAANMSYEGTPDPMNPLSLAIDAAGREDILVSIAAGNSGVNTASSPIVNNGLSVGAVDAAKVVAGFSCRGPLNGTSRPFPDVVAHGVNVFMPLREDEANFYFGSGTSFAAPQVTGAAALYRGLCNESALVTRAAILATTESVASQNPALGRNDYGVGYLRVDRLIDVARGNRWIRTARLTAAGNYDYPMPVVQGVTYNVALAFTRQLTTSTWSDMRLEIRNGATVIASSNDPLVTFERTNFVAPITGTLQVRVIVQTIEDPFGGVPIALICPEAREPAVTWTPFSSAVHPPGRRGHAMAYNAAGFRTVVFGGETPTGFYNDQWEFDGFQWTERTLLTKPSARSGLTMAYDSVRQKVVLFGGRGASGDLGDTWELQLFGWNNVNNAGPTARRGGAMTFDKARNAVVLFGGISGTTRLADTWAWNGTTWTTIASPLNPAARSGHVLVYDSVHQNTVLFGGHDGIQYRNDTWLLGPSGWTQATPATSPPGVETAAGAYDEARERVVVQGGSGLFGNRTDATWEWDGTTWTNRTQAETRTARSDHALAYDSSRRRIVRFGGNYSDAWTNTYGFAHDTWQYGPTHPATSLIQGIGCPSSGGSNTLTATTLPWADRTFVATATGLPNATTIVLTIIGLSSIPQATAPLTLAFAEAMPNCDLLVNPDILGVLITTNGTAQTQTFLPNSPPLVGVVFYHQMLPIELDGGGTWVAVTATNALRLTCGLP